ncbi:MAG: type II toxin-antitoxin system RatA family toxin [Paracoccaceae bacterium]
MPSHAEKRRLNWSADQMYALVADVASYPAFLPWTAAARIRDRQARDDGSELLLADLVISFKVFRERFGSHIVLFPAEHRIETDYLDGPFRHLHSHWQFTDLTEGGCEVDFSVDFEFKSAILQAVIGVVFDEAMRRVVRAFEARAEELYGAH